jgi:hypothetical protein
MTEPLLVRHTEQAVQWPEEIADATDLPCKETGRRR